MRWTLSCSWCARCGVIICYVSALGCHMCTGAAQPTLQRCRTNVITPSCPYRRAPMYHRNWPDNIERHRAMTTLDHTSRLSLTDVVMSAAIFKGGAQWATHEVCPFLAPAATCRIVQGCVHTFRFGRGCESQRATRYRPYVFCRYVIARKGWAGGRNNHYKDQQAHHKQQKQHNTQ